MYDLMPPFGRLELRRSVCLSLATAAMVAASSPARGQEAQEGTPPAATARPVENEALATELFNAGRDLLAEGRLAEACPKLAESVRLAPHVGSLGKLAECEERTGRFVSARGRWQQALNLARVQGDQRRERVESELARMDRIVPRVLVVLPKGRASSVEVRIDDVPYSSTALELPIPMDPGSHTVSVAGRLAEPWSQVVQLKADGAVTKVVVPVSRERQPEPGAGASASPSGPTALETAGLVATGAGLVSIGIGGYFVGVTQSRLDASNEGGCNGDRCTPGGAAIRDEARRAGNAATAFIVAGGVVAAGGLAVFLFAPRPQAPAARSRHAVARTFGEAHRLAVTVEPSGLSLKGTW
jgi:hypothetical protein